MIDDQQTPVARGDNPVTGPSHPFFVTFFTDFGARSKTQETYSLDGLAQLIATTTGPQKKQLPWLKLATFGSEHSEKRSLRHDANLLTVTGIEVDYDGEKVTFEEAVETLTKDGVLALIYTSPSHTENHPRWRILCPLSTALPPEQRARHVGRLNGLFKGIFAGESWARSQSYYFGSVNSNPSHRVEVIDGTPIDDHEDLDEIWIGKPDTSQPDRQRTRDPQHDGPMDEPEVLEKILTGESYHRSMVRLVGKWAVQGVPMLEARERLEAAFKAAPLSSRDERWQGRFNNIDRCLLDIYSKEASKNDEADTPEIILVRGSPLRSARRFLSFRHTIAGRPTLLYQNGAFYKWKGSHYTEQPVEEVRAELYAFLDQAKTLSDAKIVDFDPNRSRVADILEALEAEAQVLGSFRPPTWLAEGYSHPPDEIIACLNVLLHLPSGETLKHTPDLFTLNASPFDYDPQAPKPVAFLKFLSSIWPDDPQSIDTLQEIFGLCLTGDTRYQKIFLLKGPKRSGKGTIARVLIALLGRDNVCAPTLSGLTTNFGLAPLIGKRVAIISDARLSGKADQQVIAERFLSISGEDEQTIDRKFLPAWEGKLDARFIILTNELPRLTDSSGALPGRFVTLMMRESFYGREDLSLQERLRSELPGILLWAIEGWKRLTARGHFIIPASATAAQQELENLSSPIGAFLQDACVVGSGNEVKVDCLYQNWRGWCIEQGRDHPGNKATFGRDLGAAIPGLLTRQHRVVARDGTVSKPRFYQGVGLSPDYLSRDVTRDIPL